jgi:hypothetical protein
VVALGRAAKVEFLCEHYKVTKLAQLHGPTAIPLDSRLRVRRYVGNHAPGQPCTLRNTIMTNCHNRLTACVKATLPSQPESLRPLAIFARRPD